ncbi:hypothetical protein J6590_093811 [Homalodisca vitripennis]|nr:hypothetical protein J6590_093811 [Homalodisca vitripennis]
MVQSHWKATTPARLTTLIIVFLLPVCGRHPVFGAAGMATPTVFNSKLDGKVLKSQTREVISNVMDFMSREGKEGTFVIDPKKVRERVATAVGVSRRTLTRISAEKRKLAETTTSFETPNKVRKVPKKLTGLDDFDLGVIRRTINNFYLTEKCLPTLKKICSKLESEIHFTGSISSLRRIVRKMGYRWRKTKSNKHILMETQDVAYKRFVYLRKIQEYRKEKRPIVFTD